MEQSPSRKAGTHSIKEFLPPMGPKCIVIQVAVFWVVTPCSDVVGDGMVLKNVGILPHCYMLSQPRRPWLESSPHPVSL